MNGVAAIRYTCVLLAVLLSGSSARQQQVKIVAFGDSITAARNTVKAVFVQRLPDLLSAHGVSCEIINSGVGSSHTGRLVDNDFAKVRHALDRFDTDVLKHKPDIVIIGFGPNDAYIDSGDPDGPSRIPLSAFRKNLVYMIETLQQRGVKVILSAPCPLAPPRPVFQDARLAQYADVVRELSATYRTGLADHHELFKKYDQDGKGYAPLLPDGVHPNDEGHRIIAENMTIEILKLLKNADRS